MIYKRKDDEITKDVRCGTAVLTGGEILDVQLDISKLSGMIKAVRTLFESYVDVCFSCSEMISMSDPILESVLDKLSNVDQRFDELWNEAVHDAVFHSGEGNEGKR